MIVTVEPSQFRGVHVCSILYYTCHLVWMIVSTFPEQDIPGFFEFVSSQRPHCNLLLKLGAESVLVARICDAFAKQKHKRTTTRNSDSEGQNLAVTTVVVMNEAAPCGTLACSGTLPPTPCQTQPVHHHGCPCPTAANSWNGCPTTMAAPLPHTHDRIHGNAQRHGQRGPCTARPSALARHGHPSPGKVVCPSRPCSPTKTIPRHD